jgi:DMSO reductase anchor subunit
VTCFDASARPSAGNASRKDSPLRSWPRVVRSHRGSSARSSRDAATSLSYGWRAWRGVFNLRHSWLSREILFYLAFTVLTATMLFFPASAPALAWPAVLSGFGGLFCIDQVYESVSQDKWLRLHSGRAALTGLFLFGILVISMVDNVLKPLIIGSRTKMPTIVILFSVLGGIKLFGILGLVMGPLITAIFISVFDIFRSVEGGADA